MKRFLLALFAIICCLGCKPDSTKEDLKRFLKEYEPTTQIFIIKPDSIVELHGKKGTVLKIDHSVLQYQDGRSVTDDVEVHLLELTSKEDLLRANAQTASDGKWLISGGAYKIQVFSENVELKIADGESIEVSFPKISSEPMKIFNGNEDSEGNLNWKLTNDTLTSIKYPVLIKKDSSFMVFNREYAIDMRLDTVILNILKNKFTIENFQKEYKEIDSLYIKSDTLIARVFGKLNRRDSLWLSKDSTLLRSRFSTLIDTIYKSIAVSRLGWINIDRFYPEIRDRIEFKLIPNLEMDSEQFYAIDLENNTLLNLYGYESIVFNAPRDKLFYILAFATKDENIYGFKKKILIAKDKKLKVEYQRIIGKQIEDYFKLD